MNLAGMRSSILIQCLHRGLLTLYNLETCCQDPTTTSEGDDHVFRPWVRLARPDSEAPVKKKTVGAKMWLEQVLQVCLLVEATFIEFSSV